MKRILMLVLIGLFNRQILCAVDTLSQSEVVNTVLRENATIKASRANREAMKKRVPQARACGDGQGPGFLDAARSERSSGRLSNLRCVSNQK